MKQKNSLIKKVKIGGPSGVTEEVLANAELELQNLSEDYLKHSAEYVLELQSLLAELRSDPSESKKKLEEMYMIAHSLKGNGGTFGFILITNIAHLLCLLLDKVSVPPDEFTLQAIEVHITSLGTVNTNKLSGDGGEIGNSLLDGLDQIHEKWECANKAG